MKQALAAMAVCVLLGAAPGRAANVGGAALPDSFTADGQTLALNGAGVRTLTILRVKVYAAALYVARPSADPAAILASPGPKVVLLHFLHSASKSDIEKHYHEGEAKNCGHGECSGASEAEFERLVAATPGAAVGDTLAYVVTPRALRVLFNNRPIGEFAPDLGPRILAGFIGPVPPSEDLKRHLLGQP